MKDINQSQIKNQLIQIIEDSSKLQKQIEQVLAESERGQMVSSNEDQSK